MLALGVIAITVIAILGLFPLALTTGRSAQSGTRAPQIAQAIVTSLASQVSSTFAALPSKPATISDGSFSFSVDLSVSSPPLNSSSTPRFYASNDGTLTASASNAAFAIYIATKYDPPGFPAPPPVYANEVTVRVAWPATAPMSSQTYRDYVRIISKY